MQTKQKKEEKSSQQSTKKKKYSQQSIKKQKLKEPPIQTIQKLSRTEEIRKSSRQTDSVQNEKLKKFKYDTTSNNLKKDGPISASSKPISQKQDLALKQIQEESQKEQLDDRIEKKENESKRLLVDDKMKSSDGIKKMIDFQQASASSSTKQSDDPKRGDDKSKQPSNRDPHSTKSQKYGHKKETNAVKSCQEVDLKKKTFSVLVPIRYDEAGDGQVPDKVVKYLWFSSDIQKHNKQMNGHVDKKRKPISKKSQPFENKELSDKSEKDSLTNKKGNSFEKFEKYETSKKQKTKGKQTSDDLLSENVGEKSNILCLESSNMISEQDLGQKRKSNSEKEEKHHNSSKNRVSSNEQFKSRVQFAKDKPAQDANRVDESEKSQHLAQQISENMVELLDSSSENVTNISKNRLSKNMQNIVDIHGQKSNHDDDEEGKCNTQGGGTKQQPGQKAIPRSTSEAHEESNIDNEGNESDSKDWGHQFYKMMEDDTIYEMPYQDGTKKNSVKILVSDFNRLEPSVYLNDTLILFFLKFLQNYVLSQEKVEKIHIFNSFFMQMITQNNQNTSSMGTYGQMGYGGYSAPVSAAPQKYDINFQKMKRWTRSIDLFNGKVQYIFVPICENEHWSLATICQPEKAGQLIEKHIKWCEDGKIPKLVEKEPKHDKTHSPPQPPGDREGGNTGNVQPSTSSVTQKSQAKSSETPPPPTSAQNSKKAHNYRDIGEEAAAYILDNPDDSQPKNAEFYRQNPPVEIDEVEQFQESEDPIFLPEKINPVVQIDDDEITFEKIGKSPKFEDQDFSNDLSKDLGLNEQNPDSLRSRLMKNMDKDKEQKQMKSLVSMFESNDRQEKLHQNTEKQSSSVLIFDQLTSTNDKIKKNSGSKGPGKKSINAAEFLEATEEDIHKYETNPNDLKKILKKDQQLKPKEKKDKKIKLLQDFNPPILDQGEQYSTGVKQDFNSLINQIASKHTPSVNKQSFTSCISKNVGQKRVSPVPEMAEDQFEKDLGLFSGNQDSNKKQKVESSSIKLNLMNSNMGQVNSGKASIEKKPRGPGRPKVEKPFDRKKGNQTESIQNNLGSDVDKMLNSNNPGSELYDDMEDYQDGLHQNTNDNNDSFNVQLNEFNKEKSSIPLLKKSKGSKQPKEPKVKASKSKKKDPVDDLQYHSSLQGASQNIDNADFVEPKKKKKAKSKGPKIQKLATPDQIGVSDIKLPDTSNDFTNGSLSTMASPIQEDSKPSKKQKKPRAEKNIKKREKKETTGLKISHQPPAKKTKEDRLKDIASSNPNFDQYGISDMCNTNSYYDSNKEGGGGGGPHQRNGQNDSSIVEADDMIQTGHVSNRYKKDGYDDQFGRTSENFSDPDQVDYYGSSDGEQMQRNLGTSFKKQSKKSMSKPGMPFKIKDSNHNMGSDEVMIDEDIESRAPKKFQNRSYIHHNQNQMGKYMNPKERIEDSDEEMHHEQSKNDDYGGDSLNSSEASEENRYEKSKRMYPGQKTLSGMMDQKQNNKYSKTYDDYARKQNQYEDHRDQMYDSEESGEQRDSNDYSNGGYGTENDGFDRYLKGDHQGNQYQQKYKLDQAMGDYGDINYSKPIKIKPPEMPGEVNKDQPFILYLDSLNRVNTTNMQCLRQYLEMEYIDKKLKNEASKTKWLTEQHGWKGLTQDVMPHYQPTVPMQKNYTDCGLYLLENAEAFIKDPEFIQKNLHQKDVRLFKTRLVEDKRDIMKRIITSLAVHKESRPENPKFVGENYHEWREDLYKKMTHYEEKKEEKPADRDSKGPQPVDCAEDNDAKVDQSEKERISRKTVSQKSQKKSSKSSSSSSSSSNSQNED